MFRQETNGYSKNDVDNYLRIILDKLNTFQMIISDQKKEIEILKKRLATIDNSDEILEKARENADKIVFETLIEVKGLQKKITELIENEL